MWPPGRGHFWPQGYYLNKLGRGSPGDATYQISKPYALWFQSRRFLKFSSWKSIFSLCDLDMQWTGTIWTILKEGHIRIIPIKFGQNPASSLGDVVWSNCWRQTTHNAWRTSNDHNSSPWANGSGELIIGSRPSDSDKKIFYVYISLNMWHIRQATFGPKGMTSLNCLTIYHAVSKKNQKQTVLTTNRHNDAIGTF